MNKKPVSSMNLTLPQYRDAFQKGSVSVLAPDPECRIRFLYEESDGKIGFLVDEFGMVMICPDYDEAWEIIKTICPGGEG